MLKSRLIFACLTALSLVFIPSSMVKAQTTSLEISKPYNNDVLGIQVDQLNGLKLVEDQVLVNNQYGFSLLDPSLEYRGLVLRVTMFLDPSINADQAVSNLFSEFSDIKLPPVEDININGFEGIMVNQVPGIDPNTYIFIDINGKTYQIIYGEGVLDEQGKTLLEGLSFFKPLRSIESLELKRGNDVLYEASAYESQSLPKGLTSNTNQSSSTIFPDAVTGCVDWPTSQTMQTPISSTANGNGYSTAGPGYYGQGEHLNCNNTLRLNDYYALDFPLRVGDVVYAPFSGTVKWAGWACNGWSTLGKIVIVEKWVGSTKY